MFQTGLSLQAAQRELRNLVEIGILSKNEADNRVYYKVNIDSGFFKPSEENCGLAGVKSFIFLRDRGFQKPLLTAKNEMGCIGA